MEIFFRRNCAAFGTDFEKFLNTQRNIRYRCAIVSFQLRLFRVMVLFRFSYAKITLISYRRLAFDPFSTSSSFFLLITQLNACPIGNTTVDRFKWRRCHNITSIASSFVFLGDIQYSRLQSFQKPFARLSVSLSAASALLSNLARQRLSVD